MLDLPNSVFLDVYVGVTCLNNVAGCSHGEFVDTGVRSPSLSDVDVSLNDFSLWLLLEEGIEVVLDGVEIGTWFVTNGWEKNWALGVSIGDDSGVSGSESRVPKAEEGSYLVLGDVSLCCGCLLLSEKVEGGLGCYMAGHLGEGSWGSELGWGERRGTGEDRKSQSNG